MIKGDSNLVHILLLNIVLGIATILGVLTFNSISFSPPSQTSDRKLVVTKINNDSVYLEYTLMIDVFSEYDATVEYQMKCNNELEVYQIGKKHQLRIKGKYRLTQELIVPASAIGKDCQFIAAVVSHRAYTLWDTTSWGNRMNLTIHPDKTIDQNPHYGWD